MSDGSIDVTNLLPPTESEEEAENFQFGIWLRHRRIDGALNRVPPDFYAVCLLFRISYRLDAAFQFMDELV